MSQTIKTPKQQFYLAKLLGFDYDIQYKTGTSNVVADSLSRIDSSTQGQYFVLSIPHHEFMIQLRETLSASSEFQEQCEAIQAKPEDHPDFFYLRRFYPLQGCYLDWYSKPIHSRAATWVSCCSYWRPFWRKETLHCLRSNFQWASMLKDIKAFVRNCSTCQQVKHITRKSVGLLQPIPIPTGIWEDLSMDFVTHLPSSHGFTVVFVVVDRLSKGVHLGALPTHFTAFKVANLFLNIVCKLHGFPRNIISDRDPIFISSFWRELFRLSDTTLRMSTAYHPQTND